MFNFRRYRPLTNKLLVFINGSGLFSRAADALPTSLASSSVSIILASALIVASGIGCARQHEQKESSLVNGYRLIDAQKFDEAIAYFEELNDEEPTNRRYLVALASAYADKAGVRVQTLAPLVAKGKDLSGLSDLPRFNTDAPSSGVRADKFMQDFSSLLEKISVASSVFASIPTVEFANRVYLIHALNLLDTLQDATETEAVYRGLLRIVLLKSTINSSLAGEISKSAKSPGECSVVITQASDLVVETAKILIRALGDFGIANPGQQKELAKAQASIASAVSNLTLSMTTAILMDESSNRLLKQDIIDRNFGKLLKCGGPRDF